jgi:deoxyadenosine/deoxycytidine kinase
MDNHKPDNDVRHIAIAGNIGSGKTTLCTLLGTHYNWEVHYESTEDNPYLSDFYHDMQRWSFSLQVYFLNSRYRQIHNIQNGQKTVIQDRTIYEDAHIFAPNLHEMGLMSQRDFDNYSSLFDIMTMHIKAPDLLIYLRSGIGTLVSHIERRGRDYEGSMSLDYLRRLNERYEAWIATYKGKLLIVDVDKTDFERNKEHFGLVVNQIDAKLFGLFE